MYSVLKVILDIKSKIFKVYMHVSIGTTHQIMFVIKDKQCDLVALDPCVCSP